MKKIFEAYTPDNVYADIVLDNYRLYLVYENGEMEQLNEEYYDEDFGFFFVKLALQNDGFRIEDI